MQNKNTKKDYYAAIIMTVFFLFFFFGSDHFGLPLWLKLTLCVVGSTTTYLTVAYFNKLSIAIKVIAAFVLMTCVVVVFSYDNEKKLYRSEMLSGSWVTDDSDGYIIKLRVIEDSLFMSQSPDYKEISYTYSLNRDSFDISRRAEIVFNWKLVSLDTNQIVFSDGGENIAFRRLR